jgi:hypothetical protein
MSPSKNLRESDPETRQRIRRARKRIKKARARIRKLKKSSKFNAQEKARRCVITAATLARWISRRKLYRTAFARLAKAKGIKISGLREGASEHLPVLRYLDLAEHPASAGRYADGIDACLRQPESWKTTCKFVKKHGIAKLCRPEGIQW